MSNVKEKEIVDDGSIEIEGATEEEARQRACEALNTRLENLGFELLQDGRGKGLMGLVRGKKIRIRAWRKDERGEAPLTPAGQLAKECLKTILKHICDDCKVEAMENNETLTLLVDGDEGGLIIGKNGQTLDALQYIVRRIVGKAHEDYERQIVVNTEGYRERRMDSLESMARRLAKQVRTSQRKEVLYPMNAYERRIVHMVLKDETGVETRSQGEGMNRCIVIHPLAAGEKKRADLEGGEESSTHDNS